MSNQKTKGSFLEQQKRFIDHESQNFNRHRATRVTENEIEFKEPGTFHYRVNYLLKKDLLIVSGDLGYAIYGFSLVGESEKFTLERIAKMDVQYFHGKCICCNCGDKFMVWDAALAKEKFEQFIKDHAKYDSRYWLHIQIDAIDFSSWYELEQTLDAEIRRIDEDEDERISYDPSGLWGCGDTRHVWCDLQLIGLKKAIEYLALAKENTIVIEFQTTTVAGEVSLPGASPQNQKR